MFAMALLLPGGRLGGLGGGVGGADGSGEGALRACLVSVNDAAPTSARAASVAC